MGALDLQSGLLGHLSRCGFENDLQQQCRDGRHDNSQSHRQPARGQIGFRAHGVLHLLPTPDREHGQNAARDHEQHTQAVLHARDEAERRHQLHQRHPAANSASAVRIQARNVRSLASVNR